MLYELLPNHYTNPFIAHLAQMRDMHYWCDAHGSKETPPNTWRHHIPWSVDLDAVEQRLTDILSRYEPAWQATAS